MTRHQFAVVIEKDKDGWFAMCPDLQGCYTQGDTYEEALENIKDAIRLHVEDRIEIEVSMSDEDLIEQRRDEPPVRLGNSWLRGRRGDGPASKNRDSRFSYTDSKPEVF
ncbi:MAG TPA: type II toxin-antitoxin system HicB family antitoxin [bacterium]|nr:type II toxin-antitoxin system HicB family antitoxin [bacterium]